MAKLICEHIIRSLQWLLRMPHSSAMDEKFSLGIMPGRPFGKHHFCFTKDYSQTYFSVVTVWLQLDAVCAAELL